jgi:5'(3')-deoxyribonucleotidase
MENFPYVSAVGEQYCGNEKMLKADNLMGQVRKLGKIM